MFQQYPIPFPHLSWLASASISFLISRKIYISWRQTKSENIKNFFYLFLFLGIFFSCVSIPALLTENPNLIQIGYIFSWAFLFLPPYFALKIISTIGRLPYVEKFARLFIFASVVSFLILNFFFFVPAKKKDLENYWYWSEGTHFWIQALGGGIVGLMTLLNGSFFLVRGFKSKNKFIVKRSFLIGSGFVVLVIATLFGYIVFPLMPVSVLFSGALTIGGMLLIYGGVRYRYQQSSSETEA